MARKGKDFIKKIYIFQFLTISVFSIFHSLKADIFEPAKQRLVCSFFSCRLDAEAAMSNHFRGNPSLTLSRAYEYVRVALTMEERFDPSSSTPWRKRQGCLTKVARSVVA